MRVIFLHDVPRVGKKNEVKNVNDGFAMNFLLPKRLAILATPKAVAELEARRKEIVVEKEIQADLLRKNLEEIKGKVITVKEKADEGGHLFARVHKKEIIEAMRREHQAEIGEDYIILDTPIKRVGEFEIPIEIGGEKSYFKLVVEAV